MKNKNLLLLVAAMLLLYNCTDPQQTTSTESTTAPNGREYYQLKVYSCDSDAQVQVVDEYLEEAYLPALKRAGIGPVGVFKLRPETVDSLQKIYLLIPFKTMDQFLGLEGKLQADEAYLAAGEDYLTAAYDQPPYRRIESTLLHAFEDFPEMRPSPLDNARSERIYELRSYESPTEAIFKNKVDMFNAGGEVVLFDRLEFNAVFYGEVISGDKMPNLMYMTTFSDQESRDQHWDAFVDSPEWKEMSALPKYQNNVSHIDLVFLYPTEYSDY